MKAEVKENEVVKHWGIWVLESQTWLTDDSGIIFAVTCPRVANAQYYLMTTDGYAWPKDALDVREIT